MNQEHVMLRLLQHVATNTGPEELRSCADGSLCLHMLAAKLSETHALSVNPTKWKMDQSGNVTVTLSARDAKRYGVATCTVTRNQFEDLVVQIFSRKIIIEPLHPSAWDKFRTRLARRKSTTMTPRHVGTNVGNARSSSLNFF